MAIASPINVRSIIDVIALNCHSRLAVVLFLLLAFVPTFAGCAPNEIKWTEEVKLHDGQVIQVKRRTELTSGFPTEKRGLRKYHELCYPPLGIYWKSKPEYRPETFDIVGGKAYVALSLRGCTSCERQGYPETDAIYFVWQGNSWQRIDHKQAPPLLRFNLLEVSHYNDDGTRDARGLVTLADKARRDAGIYYELQKTGVRGLNETVAQRGMCEKCKATPTGSSGNADVFLPAQSKRCD